MTAQIHMLPNSGLDVAIRVLDQAQQLKACDPFQSIALHEEVIRLLCIKLKERNWAVGVLKHILLNQLRDEGDE